MSTVEKKGLPTLLWVDEHFWTPTAPFFATQPVTYPLPSQHLACFAAYLRSFLHLVKSA
jgi:hypothetical protein